MAIPASLRAGAAVTLTCDALDDQGAGVGDAEGFRVHVAGALPGERAVARVDHVSSHGRDAWARVQGLETRSPERVAPVCPAYGPCGGCPPPHLAYPAQGRRSEEHTAELPSPCNPVCRLLL